MKVWKAISLTGLWLMAVSAPLYGYQEVHVENGGVLSGKVSLNGEIPKPKGYNLVTFPDPIYCGRISTGNGWRLLQPFTVDSDGGFQNVVVLLTDIEKGKKFESFTPRIQAIDCTFAPYITIVRDHHKVEVVNMDPVMHDIQAYETSDLGARVLFNVPLPMSERLTKNELLKKVTVKNRGGQVMTQQIKMRKGRNIFVMQCGFHAYMESWGVAVRNPYFAKTDEHGHFTMTDVPPGTYKLVVWHPYVRKTIEHTVTINPKETTEHNIVVEAPTGRLYANEVLDHPYNRFEVTPDQQKEIDPLLKKQHH